MFQDFLALTLRIFNIYKNEFFLDHRQSFHKSDIILSYICSFYNKNSLCLIHVFIQTLVILLIHCCDEFNQCREDLNNQVLCFTHYPYTKQNNYVTLFYLLDCLFVCLYVCLYVCLFVCLFGWLFICLFVCETRPKAANIDKQ